MGFVKELILKALGKKKLIGWIGAALIAFVAFVLGEPSVYIKDALCDAPVVELPESIKAKSPLGDKSPAAADALKDSAK